MMATEPLADDQQCDVWRVAIQALDMYARGSASEGKNCPRCEYAPDRIRYHLRNYEELISAVEGVSASGASPVTSGGERGRLSFLALHADIEMATDRALILAWNGPRTGDADPPLERMGKYLLWRATRRIYKQQGRLGFWGGQAHALWRGIQNGLANPSAPEPSAPIAESICINRISAVLGWQPHDCEEG